MEHKFKIYDTENKKMFKKMNDIVGLLQFALAEIQNKGTHILIENTGIKDRKRNDVFDGDYLLYDTDTTRNFMKVKRGKIEFAFYRWDKYKKRWRKSTYQGVETYGEVIGNIYEGIKSKRLYNEMKDLGIGEKDE